jgi:hypothetical protein
VQEKFYSLHLCNLSANVERGSHGAVIDNPMTILIDEKLTLTLGAGEKNLLCSQDHDAHLCIHAHVFLLDCLPCWRAANMLSVIPIIPPAGSGCTGAGKILFAAPVQSLTNRLRLQFA